MVGFDTGIHLWRVYSRELSCDPHFFILENKSTFIVAGTCANNVRSLKEIHAWANLELPLFWLKTDIFHISALNIDGGYSLEQPLTRAPAIYVFEQK